MITAVLFDKDGTLFDYHASWSGWARRLFLELSEGDLDKARTMGAATGYDMDQKRFAEDSVLIAATPGEIAHALLPFVPGATPASLINRMNLLSAQAGQVEAAPLNELLTELRSRNLILGVVTNDALQPTLAHLEASEVLPLFHEVIGCDSGFGAKPQPGQINEIVDRHQLTPSRVVMVGDSPHDLIAARAAGCLAVGVLTGMAPRRQLAPLADVVLRSIADLPAWLDQVSSGQAIDAA
ncbi:MAG: HAD family hydrolase [Mangrovicoccus sp.]